MADNPATVSDVEFRWRPLTSDEQTTASVLLDDAWSLLKHEVPTLEDRLDADPVELDAALVRIVIVGAVLRVLRNPDGLRQETIQDYSYTRDVPAGMSAGVLGFLDDELDLLAPAADGTGDAFTIRTVHQVPTGHTDAFVASAWEWTT